MSRDLLSQTTQGGEKMNPEAAEAIRIADKHLAWAPAEYRKALALDIQQAIIRHAEAIAIDAIRQATAKKKSAFQ